MQKKSRNKSGRNLSQIKGALPELEVSESLELASDELDQAQDIANFALSPGGRQLIEAKTKKASDLLIVLLKEAKSDDIFKYRTVAIELSLIVDLLRELNGAQENADYLQKIVDDIIQESTG